MSSEKQPFSLFLKKKKHGTSVDLRSIFFLIQVGHMAELRGYDGFFSVSVMRQSFAISSHLLPLLFFSAQVLKVAMGTSQDVAIVYLFEKIQPQESSCVCVCVC